AHGFRPTEVDFSQGRAPGSEDVQLIAARVVADGLKEAVVDAARPITIEIDYQILRRRVPLLPHIHVYNEEGNCVFVSGDEEADARAAGRWRATVEIPGSLLSEGWLSVDVTIWTFDPSTAHVWERG